MRRALLLLVSTLQITLASAYSLKVQGVVTDHVLREPLSGVLVRVYRNGVKQEAENTPLSGRYAFQLENNADYVIRFSAPGMITKSFTIDTHGLVWEGDHAMKTLTIEMTMIEKVQGVDLSVFDLPMGLARFEPATGLVTWDTEYDRRIRAEVEEAMGAYMRRQHETAMVERKVDVGSRH